MTVPNYHWRTMTLVADFSTNGVVFAWALDGPINGDAFETYICTVLAPEPKSGTTSKATGYDAD